MSTFSVYFAEMVDVSILRNYFESYNNSRTCRNIDNLEKIKDVLNLEPRLDAIAFSLKYGYDKPTRILIKEEDGTCTDTEVIQVGFKTGFAIIKQYLNCLLILVSNSPGSVETLNVISYALKEQGSKPIPTEISDEDLEELLKKQKTVTGAKVEKNTRVSSMILDGELVNHSPGGEPDVCPEYSDEKGPKKWVRFLTFEKMTVTVYRQIPVKIACHRRGYIDSEDYVVNNVVPKLTLAYINR